MLSHEEIWAAVDSLAAKYGYSPSGLARSAGLDPTTFNRSKRLAPDGRQRWPSTESIAKILMATGASLDEFVGLIVRRADAQGPQLPLIGSAEAALAGRFDAAGAPAGGAWSRLAPAGLGEAGTFALEIEPADAGEPYREGAILIVQPGAPVRRGDMLCLKTMAGPLVIGRLTRETATGCDLVRIGAGQAVSLSHREIVWRGRVLWVSQ
jgi:phage repressor protein C with HTH and peptisase S24 domain